MSLFQFSELELIAFFGVLVRMSTLVAVLPLVGNALVPAPAKILLSLAMALVLYPALVHGGQIQLETVRVWSSEPGSLILTMVQEVLFGLALGYTAKLIFDAILFGANMMGNYMGFAAASMYDPHQETQSQVISEFQMALAMLLFLAVDAHHLMLRTAFDSYQVVGMGEAKFGPALSQHLISMTTQVIRFGFLLSAPIALVLFVVNVVFGVLSKAMPQLNVLVLSLGVGGLLGLGVLLLGASEISSATREWMLKIGDWMGASVAALGQK